MPHLPPAHHETSKGDSLNETKIKEKQNKTIPDLNSNLAKSMAHHNQTKELTTWFLNLPLDESIFNKSTKFDVESKTPWSTARRPKKARKVQEGHLEEGKPQKPTNGMKSGKAKQNGKEEIRKAQKSKKSSNSRQTLKISTKVQNQHYP
jgi:hypothetical protein